MDIKLSELIAIAEKVPELTEKLVSLESELKTLKSKPGYKELLTVQDLHDITGFRSSTTIRNLIADIGKVKYGGKVFVLRDDFRAFFQNLKQCSDDDVNAIIENYEINRAKNLANV